MAKGRRIVSISETAGADGMLAMLKHKGVSRREFLRFCAVIGATLAVPIEMVGKIADALASVRRPLLFGWNFRIVPGAPSPSCGPPARQWPRSCWIYFR
ncbi:twin-arginine translocation signal domain-containing protein [Thermodesulfitimonas autotrophica]|uniref:twin-arginine translocation signal domain-containing protein n=1 Tax=Thermodesulfitimonas autotrophica TaxID=1894989 RepID=UPI003FCD8DBF